MLIETPDVHQGSWTGSLLRRGWVCGPAAKEAGGACPVIEMEDEIRRLRMENGFLKKAAASLAKK